MYITDKIWKVLEPAIESTHEVTREQLEKNDRKWRIPTVCKR